MSSLERILDVLLMFAENGGRLSVADVSGQYGMSRSSSYRYLQVLASRGLIEKSGEPGVFQIGSAVLQLARVRTTHRSLVDVAEPVMTALAEETGESVLLTARAKDRVAVIASIDSSRAVRVSMAAAKNSPLHVGSFGKLHMAYLENTEREALLGQQMRSQTTGDLIDPEALRHELVSIRNQGCATSEGEVEHGMYSISAPIMSRNGAMIAAVTLAGPSFRVAAAKGQALVSRVVQAANQISDLWGAESLEPDQREVG